MRRYQLGGFCPVQAVVACIEAVRVSSELTQKRFSCLEIAGMVEENKDASHSVLCFGSASSGSTHLVRIVNTKTSTCVILFLFTCVRLPKHLSQKAQVWESHFSFPVSFLVSC